MAHARQSRPDSGVKFQVNILEHFEVEPWKTLKLNALRSQGDLVVDIHLGHLGAGLLARLLLHGLLALLLLVRRPQLCNPRCLPRKVVSRQRVQLPLLGVNSLILK